MSSKNRNTVFNDNVSYEVVFHDMKTPLSIMFACIKEIENDDRISEALNRPITDLKKSWFRIMKLISDSCDMHKIAGGRMLPTFKNYDIVALISEIIDSTKLFAAGKNISVKFESAMTKKIIATDKDIIDRILLNILSNSIKFTNTEGAINVKLEDKKNRLYIVIKDDGTGISEKDIAKVQDQYFKNNGVHNKNGSGLGLYIVKGLVALLGGNLSIGRVEMGTEVTIMLPYFTLDEEPDNTRYYDDFYSDNIIQIELSDNY